MAASLIMTGDKQVDNLLATLEPKLQKKAIRLGTRAGAKKVLERAKQLVPVDSGTLLRSMTVRTAKKQKRGTFGHTVTHVQRKGKGDPFYAHFVEFGTVKWEGHKYIRKALYDEKEGILKESQKAIGAGVAEIARKERAKIRG